MQLSTGVTPMELGSVNLVGSIMFYSVDLMQGDGRAMSLGEIISPLDRSGCQLLR